MQNELELNAMMEERHLLDNPPVDGLNRIAGDDLEMTMRLYKIKKQQRDALDKELAQLKDQITIQMGEAITLVSMEGELLATWNWSKPVVRFDTKAFKSEQPGLFAQYAVECEPVRSFLVK
jgi:hypothetical protein